ncbi:hypothetical protein E2C01_049103 [Portunus trituberculatus]|uniref:Uncharacterized protein n=1 Tax=Portunus trituberculatus TaxID=210409 RepID=A0A5B7G4R9_PORTR|nr:hypothetical protein [Portunus trituberculatus]
MFHSAIKTFPGDSAIPLCSVCGRGREGKEREERERREVERNGGGKAEEKHGPQQSDSGFTLACVVGDNAATGKTAATAIPVTTTATTTTIFPAPGSRHHHHTHYHHRLPPAQNECESFPSGHGEGREEEEGGEKERGSHRKHDPPELGLETDGLNMEKVTNTSEEQLIDALHSRHLKTGCEEVYSVNSGLHVTAIMAARVLLTKLFVAACCPWRRLPQSTHCSWTRGSSGTAICVPPHSGTVLSYKPVTTSLQSLFSEWEAKQ